MPHIYWWVTDPNNKNGELKPLNWLQFLFRSIFRRKRQRMSKIQYEIKVVCDGEIDGAAMFERGEAQLIVALLNHANKEFRACLVSGAHWPSWGVQVQDKYLLSGTINMTLGGETVEEVPEYDDAQPEPVPLRSFPPITVNYQGGVYDINDLPDTIPTTNV